MALDHTVGSRSQQAADVKKRRTEQLEFVTSQIEPLTTRLHDEQERRKQLGVLDSVSLGLYEEVDKLAKKAPADDVTDLVLEHVNDVIRETKQLIPEDTYVQRLVEFVAAGDNPQHRDVVLVLRQVRQGLKRFESSLTTQITSLQDRLDDAKGLAVAIRLHLNGQTRVTMEHLKPYGVEVSTNWLDHYGGAVEFDRLDTMTVQTYFEG